MKLKGIGIDLIETKRFKHLRNRENFMQQIVTPRELDACRSTRHKVAYWAKLFTQKEALLKALFIGLHYGSYWHDIEIIDQPIVSGFATKYLSKKAILNVSSAQSRTLVASCAVIEQ